ncbi:hypothetical protein CXF68_15885 [Tenacibaculum sp. Bg11-29]|uniref:hypothetical protein n=1 Tax=Tenacibaculum sp. Bg11-29 TaxID=2058306 RepID=UPI000C34D145|nr:hypothetical protein [Tenacibaculum sp. Bg11-29]PKH52083.1 hypothetical protein CXF68_15885 [Tenacibaculum sp. Bg11-29]
MTLKIIITIIAFANGLFMMMDGFHVIIKGKYIGPEKPGPWANTFYKLKINVFKLGPLFILLGVSWFIFVYVLWSYQNWAFVFGLLISIFTLWYIKVGTFISVITIVLLLILNSN